MRWQTIVGLLLTLGVVLFLLYRLDLAALIRVLAGAQYGYIIPLVVTILAVEYLGALQWRLILIPVKGVRSLQLFGAMMVGYMANALLPVRLGPLVRSYVVAKKEEVSVGAVLATVLTDRLLDGFAFLGLLAFVLTAMDFPVTSTPVQATLRLAGQGTFLIYLGVAGLLIFLGRFPERGAGVVRKVLKWLPHLWTERVASLYTSFCQGICLPASWRDRCLLLLYTIAKKLVIPFQVFFIALAFGLDLPFMVYLFQVVFLGFIVVLAGTLGIKGSYETGMVVALGFFGVPAEIAFAIALIVNGVSLLTVITVGLVFLWYEGGSLAELKALPGLLRRSSAGEVRIGGDPPKAEDSGLRR